MTWTDTFWTTYTLVRDVTITTLADSMNALGSVACILGGVSFSLSQIMEESLTVSVFASANTTGYINVGVNIKELNYSLNGAMPFQHYVQKSEAKTYHLTDYISPDTIRAASGIFMSSGIVLRALGANLKTWQKHREKQELSYDALDLEPVSLPVKTYLYVSAQSVSGSMTYTMFGCALTSIVIDISGFIGSTQRLTHPSHSAIYANSSHYNGPVNTTLVPVDISLDQNTMTTLPFTHINVTANEEGGTQSMANVSYGGELLFHSNASAHVPIAVPAVVGSLTYVASRFFAKKASQSRKEQEIQIYQPLQNTWDI